MGLNTVLDAYYAYAYRPSGVDPNTKGYAYRFAQAFRQVKLSDLTDRRVQDYLDSFTDRTPSAIRRDVVAIKAMLHYARRKGAVFIMPVFDVPPVKDLRIRYLTTAERDRLIAAAKGDLAHMRPLTGFMLYTGARPGEACNLKKQDIIDDQAYLTTWKGGTERKRTVPISTTCWTYIKDNFDACQPNEFMFRDSMGRPWKKQEGDRYRVGYNIYQDWRALTKRAKLVDFRPNDCRHDFATRVRATHDLGVASDLLGHANIQTTRRYAHLGASDIARKAVEGLK